MLYNCINEIPQNVTDMVNKSIADMAKATSQVLENFLCEYCEVKGIEEKELKEHLVLGHHPDGSLDVKEGEMVLFRWSALKIAKENDKFTAVGNFFLLEKKKFPKTLKAIQELKHKN